MSLSYVISIIILLLVLVLLVVILYRGFKSAGKGLACESTVGNTCKSSCSYFMGEYNTGGICADSAMACCSNMINIFKRGTNGGTTGPGGTQTVQLQGLSKPSVVLAYQKSGLAVNSQSINLLSGVKDQSDYNIIMSVRTQSYKGIADCANQEKANPNIACDGVQTWSVKASLQTVTGQQIASSGQTGITLGSPITLTTTPNSTLKGTYITFTAGQIVGGLIVPADFVGPLQQNQSWAQPAVASTQNGQILVNTYTYTIQPGPNIADFNGQTLRLVLYVYPEKSTVNPSPMATPITITFKIVPAVRIASGLDTKWAREKVVTAACANQYVQCNNIFFRVVDGTGQGTPSNSPPSNVVPSLDSSICDSLVDNIKNDNYPQLTNANTQWSLTPDGRTVLGTYPTQTACVQALAGRNDNAYMAAMNPFISALQKSGQLDTTAYMMFSGKTQVASNVMCVPTTDIKSASVPQSSLEQVYAAESFNQQTQSGVIRLNQANMAGKYLCVYGKSTTGQVYSGGRPMKIYVDRTPPTASIIFKPLSLTIFFMCADGDPSQVGITESGCKSSFGVAYISDITAFLPALFSGPQSAATWCPPYQTSSGYSTETRQSVVYNSNEVRVLCMRAEDNAGNAGVTMVTLFNGYDMLAKAILMHMQNSGTTSGASYGSNGLVVQ